MTSGLDVRGLTKRYDSTLAVASCDLRVEPGQLVGFLGPNGAGKSTTMRAIMGLITVDGGSVTWNGEPVTGDVRRRFGYMPQERGLYRRMRVLEQVEYFGRLAGLSRADASERGVMLLGRMGLGERLGDEVQELSVGNQQRVQLAVALVHRPEFLVLDEPFAGLDPLAIGVLRDLIIEQTRSGIAVLFSSHQLDQVQEMCRQVIVIDEGHTIARGDAQDIRARSRRRVVRVEWELGPQGITPEQSAWRPPGVLESRTEPSGRTVHHVPAASSPDEVMASAVALGPVASYRFEPPSLDDVFGELVSYGRRERASAAARWPAPTAPAPGTPTGAAAGVDAPPPTADAPGGTSSAAASDDGVVS